MENYWHICTEGLVKNVIFKSREDYIVGMNAIPVCTLLFNVTVLAFCLMSNHVHFIVHGDEADCRKFIINYRRKLGKLADIKGADVCMKIIDDAEYLKRAIGYVLRNPVSAGLKILPIHYEWSSASLYFRNPIQTVYGSVSDSPRTVGTLSYREKRRLLHSQTKELDRFTLTSENMINPECYVDVRAVEELFYSPARLMYFISSKENMEVELRSDILHKARYNDDELLGSIHNICHEVFRRQIPAELSIEDRYRLAEIVRKRYGIPFKQVARLTGTDPEILRRTR